tara:strand:- start:223953 stop:225893 length:1941 start_codon:yes stop_codon:yes gene_type:complete
MIISVISPLYAQDTLGVNIPVDSVSVDSLGPQNDFNGQFEEKERQPKVEYVHPWRYDTAINEKIVTNDSLLRWQIWPNWGDFYAYRREVISSRQGTIGRMDAFYINGYSPYEQRVTVDGIDLSNPLSGLVNYNHVPHHKIGRVTEQMNGLLSTDIRLKNYYLLQPISYLNYDEASDNYRNLEFMVTQNFTERTNLELSYWDRRDGGYYPRNDVEGSQIVARAYHYLNQRVQLRALFIRNQFDMEESFGYQVTDPTQFPFGVFSPSAVRSSASSTKKRRDFLIGLYHRPDTLSAEKSGLEFTLSKDQFSLPYSTDTLAWDISGYKAHAFKQFDLSLISLKAGGRTETYSSKNNRNIARKGWSEFQGYGRLDLNLGNSAGLFGIAELNSRSDARQGAEVTGGLTIATEKVNARVSLSSFSRMPSMQSLYWRGLDYTGSDSLTNENGISAFGSLDLSLSKRFTTGISARYKISKGRPFLSTDSSFVNGRRLPVLSGTVYGRFESNHLEIESSATVYALNSETPTSVLAATNEPDLKVWIRNDAFWKGYAFNRATYIKMGVRTLLAPFPYSSAYFNNELQFWQSNTASESELFAFFRMDAEVSARVRRIMVVIRWENTLEGLGQLGYFETATYPMPGRRLVVGIRAKFLN